MLRYDLISVLFVPWNFFKLNVLQDVSSQYGREPWHYYFTATLLPCLNLIIPYLPSGVVKSSKSPKAKVYCYSCLWALLLLTLLGHKEQRFLLPYLPLLLAFVANGMPVTWKHQLFVKGAYILANVAALIFISCFHKIGSTNVVRYLANSSSPPHGTPHSVLFLLPCHHTPLYRYG